MKNSEKRLLEILKFINLPLAPTAVFEIGEQLGITHTRIRSLLWDWSSTGIGEFTTGWKFRAFKNGPAPYKEVR